MRFFFPVLASWNCNIAKVYYTCEVDEERSGNVDVVVESIHCLINCNLIAIWSTHTKKLLAAGWGLLIGGGVFLFVGGTPLKGGSLSELPKTAFLNLILIRNRSFGGCVFFSSFGVLKLPHCKSILYLRGGWGKIRQCWCSCWINSLLNWWQLHKKHLKPVCLAIARLRPTESTALAMKESHLFPTWWANPQKSSETSVFGNSAAST